MNENNNKDITEVVRDKENKIKKDDLQKLIRSSVKDCFEDILNGKGSGENPQLPIDSRIRGTERRLNLLETGIDEMSKDSLSLSRRVLKLSTTVGELDKEVSLMQKDIVGIKDRAEAVKKEAEKYDMQRDTQGDRRVTHALQIGVLIVAVIAIIVSLYSIGVKG